MRTLILALTMFLFSMPALSQEQNADQFEGNDWWLVQPGSDTLSTVVSRGLPGQSGASAVLWLVALFPTAGDSGEVGVTLIMAVDCSTRTTSTMEPSTVRSNGDLVHMQTIVKLGGPLPPTSPLYRFACTDDRAGFPHYPGRDRRAIVAELLARPAGAPKPGNGSDGEN